MKKYHPCRLRCNFPRTCFFLSIVPFLTPARGAQALPVNAVDASPRQHASISGRVQNAATGQYLNHHTPAHAQFRQRAEFGSLWTFGLKGTF